MLKNIIKFEHKVGDRVYHFFCDHDSPLGEIHDALAKFKNHIVNIINENEKNKEEKAKQE